MTFQSDLDLDVYETTFIGECRDANGNNDVQSWSYGHSIGTCRKKCMKTHGCVAVSYNKTDKSCGLCRGGPYTHGTGDIFFRCYLIA